jgi:hypothetical protein
MTLAPPFLGQNIKPERVKRVREDSSTYGFKQKKRRSRKRIRESKYLPQQEIMAGITIPGAGFNNKSISSPLPLPQPNVFPHPSPLPPPQHPPSTPFITSNNFPTPTVS